MIHTLLAARQGDAVSTGHDCDSATVLAIPSQSTVFAEAKLWCRIGDRTVSHDILEGLLCVSHTAPINEGSGTVFVVGIGCARLEDGADAGSITGSAITVYAGD